MPKQENSSVPHQYSTIPLEIRQRLVDLVISKGFSIGRAARKLKIKLSTAKMIVKRYRVRGDFFESKRLRAERLNTNLERNSSRDKLNHEAMGEDPAVQVTPMQQCCSQPQEQSLLYFPLAASEIYYWPCSPPQFQVFQQGFSIWNAGELPYMCLYQ